MKKEKKIPTIYCGVEDSDGNPVKLDEEHRKKFIESMSNGGKTNVIFCETSDIPNMMKAIAGINSNKIK